MSDKTICRLKNLYSGEINSVRTADKIKNFEELLQVLSDREVLHDSLIGEKNFASVSPEYLFFLKTSSDDINVSDIAECICDDWQTIAQANDINPTLCQAESNKESSQLVLKMIRMKWGTISDKEFMFRLKNTVKNSKLNDSLKKLEQLKL